jgi:electron transfer flavoprotein alpha subunit
VGRADRGPAPSRHRAGIGRVEGGTIIRIAALIKQIPVLADLELGVDGRLRRDTGPLEMSAYCRRAVAKGVELAQATGGSCTVITVGPPSAEDVLREAVAWGATNGVHVCDPMLAGSDTIATARALVAAIQLLGGFDLILVGRNTLDADTGQVGPSVAELLGWPFAGTARRLELQGSALELTCEHDRGSRELTVPLPAVVACAERLCEPAKRPPQAREAVSAELVRMITVTELGPGPWGDAASRTTVGEVRTHSTARSGTRLAGTIEEQAKAAAVALSGARQGGGATRSEIPAARGRASHDESIAVLLEPGHDRNARELLGEAAALVGPAGSVIALDVGGWIEPATAGTLGADRLIRLDGSDLPPDVANAASGWLAQTRPWALLGPATLWGRETLSRIAARLDLGLVGDAVGLEVIDDRLVAWKPAFGGRMVAAIRCRSETQAVTIRPGVLSTPAPRAARLLPVETIEVRPATGIVVHSESQDDDPDRLALAEIVIGVGSGVAPSDYPLLEPLRAALGAELAATRKVTDVGDLPHSRQLGITGHSIAPRLYLAIGVSGKANHMIGVCRAEQILAINSDPDAPVFDVADLGTIADWREVLPLLVAELGLTEPGRLRA